MTDEGKPQIAQPANNKLENPLSYYRQAFSDADPAQMAARSGVPYDSQDGSFTLHYLGRPLRLMWPSMQVVDQQGSEVTGSLCIFIARVVLEGQMVPATGRFVSYTQIPGGDTYRKAFEGRCLKRFAFMFRSADEFARAADALGGTPLSEGDASYEFALLDDVFMRLTYWEADEEFPPSAQIQYSDNVLVGFTSEDCAVMGDVLLGELKACRDRLRAASS